MGWNMDKEDLKDIIEKNKDELFSEIAQEINNDNVTDIEWDGYNLWITELGIGSYISGKELSDRYVEKCINKACQYNGVFHLTEADLFLRPIQRSLEFLYGTNQGVTRKVWL